MASSAKPLGRSLFHFTLCQFPEFQRIDVGDFPAALVAFEDFQRRIAGAVLFVGRAGPRQDARGLQGRFPAVRKQQAEPAVLFLQHPCDLGRVALHELNHTPRAGVTNQALNHLESFCCRGREEGTFWRKVPSSLPRTPSPSKGFYVLVLGKGGGFFYLMKRFRTHKGSGRAVA